MRREGGKEEGDTGRRGEERDREEDVIYLRSGDLPEDG